MSTTTRHTTFEEALKRAETGDRDYVISTDTDCTYFTSSPHQALQNFLAWVKSGNNTGKQITLTSNGRTILRTTGQ
jgi:hypothetical protein